MAGICNTLPREIALRMYCDGSIAAVVPVMYIVQERMTLQCEVSPEYAQVIWPESLSFNGEVFGHNACS